MEIRATGENSEMVLSQPKGTFIRVDVSYKGGKNASTIYFVTPHDLSQFIDVLQACLKLGLSEW